MATRDTVEEELYCPICTDIYDDPLMLSCTHSFCRGCLQGRLQKGHVTKRLSGLSFDCPVCRKQILLDEDGLNGLPKNHLLRKMVDLYRGKMESNVKKDIVCDSHQKELGAFCDLCSEPLCIDCVVGEHKGHPIESVDEAYTKRKRLLDERKNDITEDLKLIWNAKDTELKYIDQLEDMFQTKRASIEAQFNDYIELLTQTKNAVLAEIDTRHKRDMVLAIEGVTSMKGRETELKEELKEIKSFIKLNKMELLKKRCSKFNQRKSHLLESDLSPLMTSRSSTSLSVPDCSLDIDGAGLTSILNDVHLVWEQDIDTCSPKHLSDKMSRLYETEWRAALQESSNKNKDDTIKNLLNLFIDTYRQAKILCESQLDSLAYHVMQPDIDVVIGDYNIHGINVNIEQEFKKSTLFCSVKESVRKLRAQHATNISEDMIFTTYHDQSSLVSPSSVANHRHLATYINKCFELVYNLRIQDPPMFVPITDPKLQPEVDKDEYRYVKRKGRKNKTIAWPPLYLYEGGPLLTKGIIFMPG